MKLKCLAAFCFLALTAAALPASDWPRWLGPNGDNIAPADESFQPDLNQWKIAWKAEVGLGYSSLAVVGDAVYTMGHNGKAKGAQETVYRLNAATGAEVWKYSYDAKLMPDLHPGGPNATPTVAGNKLITVSKDGQVHCLTADKGAFVWKANLLEIFGIKMPRWGFASSAVIDGNQVFFCGGKAGALDLETGKPLWTSKTAYLPGYASLPVFELDGKKYAAALDGKGFSVLSAADGTEIVHRPFKALFDMNATTPVVLSQANQGKRILISNTITSEMLAFDGKALTPIWTSTELRNLMNNCVIQSGAIYGISGEQEHPDLSLVSLNEADGKLNWAQPNIGYGTTIGIGKTILVLNETGNLISVKADPAKYTEISRRKVLEHVCWTTPTYAGGKIFLRNDHGNVVVLGQ